MVHVQTAGQVAAALNAMRPRPQIAVMRETLGVWHPLFDRLVALWCDTVDGDLPRLAPGSGTDGTVIRRVALPALARCTGPSAAVRGWRTTVTRRKVTNCPAAAGPPRVTSRGCGGAGGMPA